MRALVLGCGRVGAGVARELATRRAEVAAVDVDPAALDRLGEGFAGRRVLGSCLEELVLHDAGIATVDAVAVVTGDDAVNAVVALVARRRFQVPTVVARLHDPRSAVIHQRLGIRTLAPVTWGIQRIADLVVGASVAPTASLGIGGVEVVEVRVPVAFAGHAAAELQVDGEIDVIAVTRHGQTVLATPMTRFVHGDLAHLAVTVASRGRLDALLEQR
jgi:trk system potassium uptake protein